MKKYLFSIPVLFFTLLIIYKVDNNAYIYAFLVLLIYCFTIVFLEKREKLKLTFIYLGSILFALFIAEFYYSYQYDQFSREFELVKGKDIIRNDSILGVVPMENSKYLSRAKMNGELVYEVTITVDEFGQRIMPKAPQNDEAVLFFGCSFTFGDGVEDHETLPYQFQQAADVNYDAYNFSYSGYGAHHTLTILENKLEKRRTANYPKKTGFYVIIADHVLRGTYSGSNTHSPKYRFDENGELYRAGSFSSTKRKIIHYLGKSNLKRVINPLYERPRQKDIDLMVSMTKKSEEIFEERYKSKFYCLLWRVAYAEYDGLYEKLLKALHAAGIKVIEVDTIIPDYIDDPYKYVIRNDLHPNALANKMIAEYLVDFLGNQQ